MVAAFADCPVGEFAVNSECIESKFQVTTTTMSANTTFSFYLSAKGIFYVDWGDGNSQLIDRSNKTGPTQYSHSYANAGSVKIQFGGLATGYNSSSAVAAMRFYGGTPELVASVSGSLSALFPYMGTGNSLSPKFKSTFQDCVELTSLPETLFSGYETGSDYMFQQMCYGCTSLTDISPNLFGNITTGGQFMFAEAFRGCVALSTIPGTLFNRITTSGNNMFISTFQECSSLTSLPPGLFSGITTAAPYLFARTFYDCTSLSGYIPASLFSGLIANNSPDTSSFMANIFTNTDLDTTCPPNITKVTTGYESYWGSYVSCKETEYNCSAGYYLPANGAACAICPAASYCPGGVYNVSAQDQGINPCPAGYTYNIDAGKTSINQCQIHCNAGTYADTYTELEYLESTGTQYINTGFIPNKQSRMIIDFYVNRPEKPWIAYVGNTNAFGVIQSTNTASTSFLVYNGSNSNSTGFWRVESIYGNGVGRYTVDINQNNVTIYASNGSSVSNTFSAGADYQLTTPLYLFGGDRDGNLMQNEGATIRIYSAKLYDNGQLVRDFIPVRRNIDGVLGMYDRVTKTLYTNAGSDNFYPGQDGNAFGNGQCANVGVGYYAPSSTINYGSVGTRTPCPTGTYSAVNNASSCTQCSGSTYNDETAAAVCKSCPSGYTYNIDAGKTSINQCQIHCNAGTYADTYTELEYLESTGTQYINTGFIPNKQSRMIIDFYVNRPEKPWIAYVGNTNAFGVIQSTNTASTSFLVYNGSNSNSTGFWRVESIYGNGVGRYTVDINQNNVTIYASNGSSVSNTFSAGADYQLTTPLYLFGGDRDGNLMQNEGATIRIYSAKLYDNGQLVRDFIPVRRNIDGVLGMYDRVTKTLYTNAGSDNFYPGQDGNAFGNGQCANVGVGYWAAASTINYGSIVTRNTCPNEYPLSDIGAGAQTDCYASCTTTQVPHATAFSGRYYYGGTSTCVPADSNSCDTGYTYVATNNNVLAHCDANIINLTWYNNSQANGGTVIDVSGTNAISCTYGESFVIPNPPSARTGYIFDGWQLRQSQ